MPPMFRSVLAAVAWWSRNKATLDGLRAAPVIPTAGPRYKRSTAAEDRYVLHAIIGLCLQQSPAQARKTVLLCVEQDWGVLDLAAHWECSERTARRRLAEACEVIGKRFKRKGVIE
jgi:DNA-directed RNA polymerase specialized sigma24 family protein